MSSPHPRAARAASEYDTFADIYSLWTDTAASTGLNLPFYVERYTTGESPIVELGVGDGRIAVAAASLGCDVIGVDASAAMLELCRERAREAGVADRLTLLEADFRNFQLERPAGLIALPYHSIGHLTTPRAKQQLMRRVFAQLRPGGRFIFDDFVITPQRLARMREVQLRAAYRSPSGRHTQLWVSSLVNEPTQSFTVITWTDELDAEGMLEWRRYRRLSLSWLQPAQARHLLVDAGFEIEACLGDFLGSPFSPDTAIEQVWIARKPARG